MTDTTCPCRLRDAAPLPYSACCAPVLEAGKPAATAQALMRARYSAFALGKIDFLYESLGARGAPRFRPQGRDFTGRRSRNGWDLRFFSTEQGEAGDATGFVEFIAHFVLDGEERAHRERSLFRFDADDGRWYFVDEANRKPAPIVKGAQPGRNDPCPCGSGKKYKKCCGAAA